MSHSLRKTCIDCKLAFGLVDRHPDLDSICTSCAAQLLEPLHKCQDCDAVMQVSEFCWGDWGVYLCWECAPDRIREEVADLQQWFPGDRLSDPPITLRTLAEELLCELRRPINHQWAISARNNLREALDASLYAYREAQRKLEAKSLEV